MVRKCERSPRRAGQLAGDKPGVGLLVGVLAFGGRKIHRAVARHQAERVGAPVAVRRHPKFVAHVAFTIEADLRRAGRLFCYVSINSEVATAFSKVVPQ
jgi:hypothetical protein